MHPPLLIASLSEALDTHPTNQYKKTTAGRWENNIFEPIPEFFFGYSLGGYSHREH
jgi:hypothetical protein